ncbi:uncharacterized protein FOMMEDRAFT_168141 [Fomitiporia mediterranea MF3/22]|uniref:uncharacterized protein n=1 Tax=Fomitiporia mediterranea (strain MF3/22) TaxID=694068 RepID=UPI00044088CD|nr:uncharacterized protein FOMMEDRAFT_168141 [Fomitiporia mediterranea MF3/22]EJD03070.1 hypothetical protein FOMMEDRAFT_168141 [Fomitiporia mediterranea MF3/22]
MQLLGQERGAPVTSSPTLQLTATPRACSAVSTGEAMSAQVPYYRDPYSHARSSSGGSHTSPYSNAQYPSPPDSSSSRSFPNTGGAYNHNSPQRNSRSRNANARVYVSNAMEVESREDPLQFSITQSPRNPSLHFLLARDSARENSFTLDLNIDPCHIVPPSVYQNYGALWVTRDRPLHFRIVSREFPWVIDIRAGEALEGGERGVTCGDVWSHLYHELAKSISNEDWAHLSDMAATDRVARGRHEYLVDLARQQIGSGNNVSLVRLDWLMRKTVFVGLERDEGYRLSTQRLLPGSERCTETWVAHFAESE